MTSGECLGCRVYVRLCLSLDSRLHSMSRVWLLFERECYAFGPSSTHVRVFREERYTSGGSDRGRSELWDSLPDGESLFVPEPPNDDEDD